MTNDNNNYIADEGKTFGQISNNYKEEVDNGNNA